MSVLPTLPTLPSLESLLPGALKEGAPRESIDVAGGFGDRLRQAFEGVDAQQHDAARQVEAVETGQSDDLVGAMLSSQQAGLSFSMLVQVRNKVMNAFDDIMKMNV